MTETYQQTVGKIVLETIDPYYKGCWEREKDGKLVYDVMMNRGRIKRMFGDIPTFLAFLRSMRPVAKVEKCSKYSLLITISP